MRMLFVARAIDNMAGGVERMIITVMNAMLERGHSVELFTWDRREAVSFYPMAPEIIWHKLAMGDAATRANINMRVRRAFAVRSVARKSKPDVIVCFQAGPFMAIRAYTIGMGLPVIAAERNAPTRFDFTSGGPSQWLIYTALRTARRILVQCESYRAFYPHYLRDNISTIPNPVFPALVHADAGLTNSGARFCLLSVGRLSYQKNYAVLIKAFALVAAVFPDWDLTIVGEGEERDGLTALVAETQLQGRVRIPGVSQSISEYYVSSHLFCLSSRWEGFPNALVEAMAHGLPVVGFADCAGMRDLIEPNVSGLLAVGNGDATELASALRQLMSDASQRRVMGIAAREQVADYEPGMVFSRWEATLRKAIEE